MLIHMATAQHISSPSVYIDGVDVVIADLRVNDGDLLEFVKRAEDLTHATQACLSLGARVLRMTQTTVDSAMVEGKFAQLEERIEQGLANAIGLIAGTAAHYLDPEAGALKMMLAELERALDDAFDPTSKASVLAKFE